jgi:hypothetical protein
MPRLTKGGREIVDQLLADLASAVGAASTLHQQVAEIVAALPRRIVVFNPDYAIEQLAAIRELLDAASREQAASIDRMRRRVRDDLEPMLRRQQQRVADASLPERVAALERRADELSELDRLLRRIAELERRADESPPGLRRVK